MSPVTYILYMDSAVIGDNCYFRQRSSKTCCCCFITAAGFVSSALSVATYCQRTPGCALTAARFDHHVYFLFSLYFLAHLSFPFWLVVLPTGISCCFAFSVISLTPLRFLISSFRILSFLVTYSSDLSMVIWQLLFSSFL